MLCQLSIIISSRSCSSFVTIYKFKIYMYIPKLNWPWVGLNKLIHLEQMSQEQPLSGMFTVCMVVSSLEAQDFEHKWPELFWSPAAFQILLKLYGKPVSLSEPLLKPCLSATTTNRCFSHFNFFSILFFPFANELSLALCWFNKCLIYSSWKLLATFTVSPL